MTHFTAGLMRRICVSLGLTVLPLGLVADAVDFYKDRTITFIIGSAPGGGYDTYSRLVASHLGGQPTIVPQNVPGAGSIRAANYLYSVAPTDGTTIGMVDEAIFLNQILGVQEPTTDAAKRRHRPERTPIESSSYSVTMLTTFSGTIRIDLITLFSTCFATFGNARASARRVSSDTFRAACMVPRSLPLT
jgi:hypothetical protein